MKILLVGGGTLGSVNPLIAIYEEAKKQGKPWHWFWVGTKSGPERAVVHALGIPYEWLPVSKLRRYVSWRNLFFPVFLLAAWLRSLLLMMIIKPDVVVSVGSFVAVPVVWAAWLFRKKIIIHQQDIRPGLANKLCAPCADKITVSFAKSLDNYSRGRTELVGNPMRSWIEEGNKTRARELWHLDNEFPTILIMGGSSGAEVINEWTWQHVSDLTKVANIIHITGIGKMRESVKKVRYEQVEFLGHDLAHALVAVDIVVSRAGISTLTELAYVKKPTILIPILDTHQEANARFMQEQKAVIVFNQHQLDEKVVHKILQLLSNPAARAELGHHIGEIMQPGARERMVEIVEEVI